MGWLAVATVTMLVATVAGIPLRDSVGVVLVRAEHDELEARVTWGDDRRRQIWIDAKRNRLSIRSSAHGGELLVYGEKIEGSGTFYTAQGQSFFATETQHSDGRVTKTEYAVPNSMGEEAKEAFKQRKIDRMLGSFEQSRAQQLSEGAIRELVQRSEVKVLEEAAQILGERGVIGAENAGALLFYMTVMNMVRGREGHVVKRGTERETLFGREHHSPEVGGERGRSGRETSPVLCSPTIQPTHTQTQTLSSLVQPPLSSLVQPSSTPEEGCTVKVKVVTSRESGKVVTNTESGGFLGTRKRTEIYISITICPSSTATEKNPTPPVVRTGPTSTPTPEKTPCPSPPPTDYDPPSNLTADYLPYSTKCCALPLPKGIHPCQENHPCTQLCEDCHHCYECKRGRCPSMTKCLGMCGYGCWCWSIVCGDCCYWEGCHKHDNKCRESFFSLGCLLPFKFRCGGY